MRRDENENDRMANKKQVVLNLFANPNWIFVTSMTVVALTQFVNVILLANCAATMTPEDCQVPPELAQGLWQGQQPPPFAIEHKMCLVFAMQYIWAGH